MERRFDCERCGVNVAYHGWPCIAAQINERESERGIIGPGGHHG